MSDTCARCATVRAIDEFRLRVEWVDYLRENRGMGPPIGTLKAPVCADCYAALDQIKHRTGSGDPLDGSADGLDDGVRAELDRLNLDALIDDLGQ